MGLFSLAHMVHIRLAGPLGAVIPQTSAPVCKVPPSPLPGIRSLLPGCAPTRRYLLLIGSFRFQLLVTGCCTLIACVHCHLVTVLVACRLSVGCRMMFVVPRRVSFISLVLPAAPFSGSDNCIHIACSVLGMFELHASCCTSPGCCVVDYCAVL